MRAISELIALLVVIAIVVGVTVGATSIISGLVERQNPKVADVVVSGGKAYLDGTTLVVKVSVTALGSDPVSITGVAVFKGTQSVSATSSTVLYPSGLVYPGNSYELIIYLYGFTGSVAKGDTLTVVIYWSNAVTKASSVSRGTAVVT